MKYESKELGIEIEVFSAVVPENRPIAFGTDPVSHLYQFVCLGGSEPVDLPGSNVVIMTTDSFTALIEALKKAHESGGGNKFWEMN